MSEGVVERTEIESVDLQELFNPFQEDDGSNKDLRSHYVSPGDNLEFQAKHGSVKGGGSAELVNRARFLQAEIIALCGYRFVPKHNPKNHPVCETCADIAANRILGE